MSESPADLQRRRFLRDSARYALMLGATSLPLLVAARALQGASAALMARFWLRVPKG
mgnify:CR=1 FL=1